MGEPNHATIQERFHGPPEALLARCAFLEEADKRAEVRAKALMIAGIFALVCAGASFVFLPMVNQLLIAVGVAFGLFAVALFVARYYVKLGDLEDRKLHAVWSVVHTLLPEIKRSRPVEAAIDFRGHHKVALKNETGRGGEKALDFEHPWLTLAFVLADGTKVRLEGTLHAKRKTRRKRKYTKIKERAWETLTVSLAPPAGKSFTTQSIPSDLRSLGHLTLVRARLRPNEAELTWKTKWIHRQYARSGWSTQGDFLLDGQRVLGALVTSYKALAAAERRAA